MNSVLTVGGGPVFGAVYFNTAGLAFTGGAVAFTIGTYGCELFKDWPILL